MSSSQTLGGSSRAGRIIGPSLDKIIKNVAWRKHSNLVASCKSALDKLETIEEVPVDSSSSCSIYGLSLSDAEAVVAPLLLSLESGSAKVVEPALECIQKLFSFDIVQGEIFQGDGLGWRLVEGVCKFDGVGDDGIEISVLRVLVAAATSTVAMLRGECLVDVVKSLYNLYLGSHSAANQVCAKAVLVQIMLIVCGRVDADRMDVKFKVVSIVDILDLSEKSLNDSSIVQFAQNFINEVMGGNDVENLELKGREVPVQYANGSHEEGNVEAGDGENVGGGSKIRDDGLFLFRNLCKFSMKFSTQDNPEDHLLLRGKILSLELLKTVVENAGQIWRNDDKFLGAIKQYLCLSILKNSALSVMSIFQLLCSIFTGLLSRFRSGLKGEIGIFFPMLVLRVLENVLQPSFLQKLTVLNSLEKVFHDPQIIIDIFVNYDCDVDAPNIFERTVNALLKTALGVPPGSTTTLSPAQDMTFRLESVKCLTCIIKSMGTWMDQQLRIGNFSLRAPDIDITPETPSGEDGSTTDFELQHDMNSGLSDALTLEQTRAYKIEVQKGISLFNRKPSKGIEFLISTKKIGGSPEEVASFLRNASGLNETMIGDYLGDRDEFPLKVMHAYVDLLNFEGMDFGEAIRFFLRGFRLPGEAQKIDRIMEKFAEHYCKCNPSSFTSADTAYVLAYSVIMLNTDAHNNMVKEKMSKVDFIRNNRGIDDGKDLPEDYLGSLYDQIVKNEIKMKSDSSVPQHRQANGINKLLGLDTILNLVSWKQHQEKPLGANDVLIKHIQDQFKAKTGKQEPVFYAVMDATILRFMMESCWAPMMAAFSVTLDQSDDRTATSQCLQGFRCAVHVTSVMSMRTQRDAFVTSVAKFTYLHNAADMKQKNVDAVKAIISIAIEDGNYLEDAWEHVLTCLSRFEHLQLLGEGVPTDASFLMVHSNETEEKSQRPAGIQTLKKKALQNPAVIAVMRGGSYDSTSVGINASGLVSQEQISSFISNLNLLDQVGNFELNHIFAHSQRLNSEAIVAFVKALCKVSMAELQSPTDPRVFCLTKIVEIAHYNMNRIRLVWSRIWNVLSDFFVTVGISENLSVAIFVMDSLRQLAMKFLEREELANYNFQNEFLRPFVIVMQKSSSAEIRELIVRCISQMVLSRVNNVKSGWKSVFMVFTCAAADERKNIVQLAFQTIEKIVRDYFPYITETEATIFTDCVRCLITFTNSKFSSDVSLNAIAFLRFCAVKLAEGGLVCYDKSIEYDSVKGDASSGDPLADKDDNFNYWVPLLAGLSKLTSDPRSAIRKGAMEVLFNILKDHGQLFSHSFWMSVFNSFIFPIFSDSRIINYNLEASQWSDSAQHDEDVWSSETQTVAAQCLVDLYVNFFEIVRHLLPNVVSIFMSFIRSPYNSSTSTGVAALLRLTSNLSSKLTEKEWSDILESLKEAALSTFPEFLKIIRTMESMEIPDIIQYNSDAEFYSENEVDDSNLLEDNDLDAASYSVARMKGHIAVQLLLVQALTNLYESHSKYLSSAHVKMIMDVHSSIASHSSELGNETALQLKFQKACTHMDISEPPLVHFENESHQSYLTLLQTLLIDKPPNSEDIGVERQIVEVCQKILHRYLNCASCQVTKPVTDSQQTLHWILPLGSAKKEELAARTSLVVRALHVLNGFERDSFRKYVPNLFPLLVSLVRCEHSSGEVQLTLREIFRSSIGPIILYP